MDANTIVCELYHQGVISYGDMVMIQRTAGAIEQNQLLHDYLKRTCTEEALMKVCDMMMAVPGNPSMRVLGKEMKTIMEGKWCVCVSYASAACYISTVSDFVSDGVSATCCVQ